MKHSTRIPHRILTASLLLCGLLVGTGTRANAGTWRDFAVDREPAVYFVGNQDFNTNDCVGWSCRGALLGTPVHAKGFQVPPATTIYSRAMKLKTRSGDKIDTRHGAEALRGMGLIDDYETLHNPYEIWDWLKYKGPVAAAIYWDERLTNHRGSLREVSIDKDTWTTQKAHAITILGWDAERRAFYFTPNLGTGWGTKGFAFLRETDFPHVFVNAVGFEHEKELDAKAIGPKPPGDRDKMRAAAATNIWYTSPGPMKTAKLGEARVNVGANLSAVPVAKPAAEPVTKPVTKSVAKPVAKSRAKPAARKTVVTPIAKISDAPAVVPSAKPATVSKTKAEPRSKTWAKKAWLESLAESKAGAPLQKTKESEDSLFAPRKRRGSIGRRR